MFTHNNFYVKLYVFINGSMDYERRKQRHMLDSNVAKKQIKLLFKNKKRLKELKIIFDWVEEITIKLRLNIITLIVM